MCRSDRVTVEDTYQYDDSANDVFEREPYCVKFVVLNRTGAPALLPLLLHYFLHAIFDLQVALFDRLFTAFYYYYSSECHRDESDYYKAYP